MWVMLSQNYFNIMFLLETEKIYMKTYKKPNKKCNIAVNVGQCSTYYLMVTLILHIYQKHSERLSIQSIHTYLCVSGVKKCSFSRIFGVPCFVEKPVLRFTFLPYYRRITVVFACDSLEITMVCSTIVSRIFFN